MSWATLWNECQFGIDVLGGISLCSFALASCIFLGSFGGVDLCSATIID